MNKVTATAVWAVCWLCLPNALVRSLFPLGPHRAGVKLGWEQGITQSERVDRAIRIVAIEDHILKDISCATRKLKNLKE